MTITASHSLQPFVDRLALRSSLGPEEKDAILGLPSRSLEVAARRDVVRLGEPSDYASFIVSGLTARYSQTRLGSRQLTGFHIRGDMADLHSVVRPSGVSALQALTSTTVLRIPHQALRQVAAAFPAIAEAFWRHCAVDTATLMQWLLNIGRRDATARIAHLLCEMAVRFGGDCEPSSPYAFEVTQEQLGDATGLTAVHVNRTLKKLRNLKLVTCGNQRVSVENWAQLVEVADFDSAYLSLDTKQANKERLLAA